VVSRLQRFKLDEVRQRFRLTSTEIRVAGFVAAAFVLGLITKCYRDAHRTPTPVQTHPGRTVTSRSTSTNKETYEKRAAKPGHRATRPLKSEEKLDLSDSATKQDYRQK